MKSQGFTAIILFTIFLSIHAQTTTGYNPLTMKKAKYIYIIMIARLTCQAQSPLPAIIADEMNQALYAAYESFEQNPTYSSANSEFAAAMNSFPASVTSSLLCSGYQGINMDSLPTWLTSVPTAVVSLVLHEQQVYESIESSFEEEASMSYPATSSGPESTVFPGSPRATSTSGVSATTSSSSAARLSGSFNSGILAVAGGMLARLLL
jgi:hypothetical protein